MVTIDESDLKGLVEVLNEAADILEVVGQSVPDVVERCKNWRWPLADELSGFACMLADAWQRAQAAPVVPEGWRLVPTVATLQMKNAGWQEIERQGVDPEDCEMQTIYCALIAAAPQPGAPIGLMTVAQHQRIVAAMAAELEQLRKDAGAEMFLTLSGELARTRAELEAARKQKPAAWLVESPPEMNPVKGVADTAEQAGKYRAAGWSVTPVYTKQPEKP